MHQRKREGILRHSGDESLRGLKELVSEPGALTFLPPVRFVKLRSRRRLEENAVQCALMRLRTSSHGTPPGLPDARARSSSSDRPSTSSRGGSAGWKTAGLC